MPVRKDRQWMATVRGGGGDARGGSTIAGADAGGATASSGREGGATTEVGAGAVGAETGSCSGIENADVSASTTGEDGAAAGMVKVSRCTRSGIASEPISTAVHAVMCECGWRTRRSVKPSQTTTPRASTPTAEPTG